MKNGLSALVLLGGLVQAQEPKPLTISGRIELAGVKGRIDHFTADVNRKRLFMAALGNETIEVLDVVNAKRLRTIRNLAEPQGLYYESSTNRLFVGCRKDATTKVFDADSDKLLGTANFPGNVDNIRFDTRARRIVVGYGSGTGALGFLDLDGRKTGSIALDGHPESFQLEKGGSRVFVNVPDHKEIAVADVAKNAVIAKWPVTSAVRNFPMALDEGNHRLLIGCREPAKMLIFDTQTGKQTASVDIVGDTDDLFYDAARRRVYVIGGEGFVDIFEQRDADRYSPVARVATAPGARTGLFVADWGKLFVAVPHRGEQRAQVLVLDAK
jgi:DNA-binding beta-propeller fold protein YncE